jgi:hypothetical protein
MLKQLFNKIMYVKNVHHEGYSRRFIWIKPEIGDMTDLFRLFSPYSGWGLYINDGVWPLRARVYIKSKIREKFCELRRKEHVYVTAIGICKYCGKC